jgi:outer membrane protein TolC
MKNNRYRLTALATAVCFFTLSQQVQAQQKLTLKEAVQLSLTNSKKIRYDSARIAQATAALKEAVERKLPDVTASGSYMALNTPHISLKTGGNGGSGETPKVNQVSYGLVSASLPVFAGGKIRYGIEAARLLEKAEKLDAESNREEVVMNTVNAYAALYKTRRAIELIDSNLVQARQRVKDFTNLEKNGIIARNDLLKAELQQSNIELQLLDAQNNYKLACVSMDILTGLDEKTLLET